MIENTKKILAAVAISLFTLTTCAQTKQTDFNWNNVIEAIIQVESNGNPNATNGKCVGLMQISPILVRECNKILKERKISKRFTLSDRKSKEKSKEMFILIQSEYNKSNNVEKAIKGWNGGVHYKDNRRLHHYYQKVMKHIK